MNRLLNNDYQIVLNSLKEKIRLARYRAFQKVNTELLIVYRNIGTAILEQQKQMGWGAKIIEKSAFNLKLEFPDLQGVSVRNLEYMRAFVEAYQGFAIVQPVVAQLEGDVEIPFVQHPVAQISRTHHTIILNKTETWEERIFYIKKTLRNWWSKSVLSLQIDNKFFERQGKAIVNKWMDAKVDNITQQVELIKQRAK